MAYFRVLGHTLVYEQPHEVEVCRWSLYTLSSVQTFPINSYICILVSPRLQPNIIRPTILWTRIMWCFVITSLVVVSSRVCFQLLKCPLTDHLVDLNAVRQSALSTRTSPSGKSYCHFFVRSCSCWLVRDLFRMAALVRAFKARPAATLSPRILPDTAKIKHRSGRIGGSFQFTFSPALSFFLSKRKHRALALVRAFFTNYWLPSYGDYS